MSHYARHSCISLVVLRAYRKNVFFSFFRRRDGKTLFCECGLGMQSVGWTNSEPKTKCCSHDCMPSKFMKLSRAGSSAYDKKHVIKQTNANLTLLSHAAVVVT